jgi:pimeloyl-ACP methyl ester carboxylesterase
MFSQLRFVPQYLTGSQQWLGQQVDRGTADRLATYSGAILIEQRIPGARLRSIEGGRHSIALEFPDTIALWVREFLEMASR